MRTFRFGIFLHLVYLIAYTSIAQVVRNETLVSLSDDGEKVMKRIIRLRIQDRSAAELAHVEIRHSPSQDFSFQYGRIMDGSGKTRRSIKKKDLVTRSDLSNEAFYQDNLVTEFDLFWDVYPYEIEYAYTISEREYLHLTWWSPMLFAEVPTIFSSLQVTVPAARRIEISQSAGLNYSVTEVEGRKTYKWLCFNSSVPKNEIYAPPLREIIPWVAVVPREFQYGVAGSWDSWTAFGAWFDELNQGTDFLPVTEKTTVDFVVQDLGDTVQIIKKLYHYLQDRTKYVNVAIDVGGMKSYPATYVCENKYGDCKALTTYMKAMLASLGIESYYALVNAGSNGSRLNSDHLYQQFNHVIAVVPINGDTLWLENTSNALPFNYLGTFTQNKWALMVNGKESRLIKTPKLAIEDVEIRRQFNLPGSGGQRGSINMNLRGGPFERVRYLAANGERGQLEQAFLAINAHPSFKLQHWELVDSNRDSSNVEVRLSGEFHGLTREFGGFQVLNPLRIEIPDFQPPGKRSLPVRMNVPISYLDKTIYPLEDSSAREIELPEPIDLKSSFGNYSTAYTLKGDAVEILEHLTIFAGEIPLEDYPMFYSFIAMIIDHKKTSAIIIQ